MEIRKQNGDVWVLSKQETMDFLKIDNKPKERKARTQDLEEHIKIRLPNKNKAWATAEDKLVTSTLSAKRIAKQLGRTKTAVYARRCALKRQVVP